MLELTISLVHDSHDKFFFPNRTLIANALSKLSIALSGSPKFNCALPRVIQA